MGKLPLAVLPQNTITALLRQGVLIASAALLSSFWISTFLPFAQYSKFTKAGILAASMGIGYVLSRWAWNKFILPNCQEIKRHWAWHSALSVVFTLLILSLTQFHQPLTPVELTIKIETTQPIGFSSTALEHSFGKRVALDPTHFHFEGEWNYHKGIVHHMGTKTGTILYQQRIYVSDPIQLHFYFHPQPQPASVNIIINQTSYPATISASQAPDDIFVFTAEIPELPSYSRLYQIWRQAIPYMRGMLVFLLFWVASAVLRPKTPRFWPLFLRYTLCWVLSYFLLSSLSFQSEFVNLLNHNLLLLLLAITAFTGIPAGIAWLLRKRPNSEKWMIPIILLVALILRLYWIRMVPTAQVSDFGRFHQWALQLAQGTPGLFIDRYSVFTRLLSLLYRLSPTVHMAQGFNLFLSLLSALGLYWIGKEIGHPSAGVLAAYFFSIFPSEIAMVGIVCTDIPSVAALIFCTAFLMRYMRLPQWYWLAGSGFLFAVAFQIRAPMLIYAPILLLPLFFQAQRSWKQVGKHAILIGVSFLVGTAGINLLVTPITVDDMTIEEGKNVIWPLLNGTNIAQKGRNNDPDYLLIQSWTPEEAWQIGLPMVIKRVFANPIDYYHLLRVKYSHIFANGTYGADLAFLGSDMNYKTFQTRWRFPAPDVRQGYAQFSQYSYWCILAAAVLLAFQTQSDFQKLGWSAVLILLCALGAYAFFEVQPRYQRPVIPYLILSAALLFSLRAANQTRPLPPRDANPDTTPDSLPSHRN